MLKMRGMGDMPLGAWRALVRVMGGFLDEAALRISLALDVLVGTLPMERDRRIWNRNTKTPVLIDIVDWTTERKVASVYVWPPLEEQGREAVRAQYLRVDEVKSVIAKGASEMAWATRFDTDWGLRWDSEREVWSAEDGFAVDGKTISTKERKGA